MRITRGIRQIELSDMEIYSRYLKTTDFKKLIIRTLSSLLIFVFPLSTFDAALLESVPKLILCSFLLLPQKLTNNEAPLKE
jgi:hypothetical protein